MKLRKTTKAIALGLAVTLLAAGATGCTKGSGDKTADGKTQITVGGWPQKKGTELDNYNARKEKFEADNDDASIVPDSWKFDLKTFYAKASGGQLPIVFNTHYTEIKQCMESGYASDLTDGLKKRGYDGKFNPKVLDIVSDDDGHIYAFPNSAYVLGLGYNVEMFEKAGLMEADGTPKQPKDWNEVVEFAKKIKAATGKAGFSIPTTNNNGGWIFTDIAWSFGAEFMKQNDDGSWTATINTPEVKETLEFVKAMKWEHDILPSNSLINNDTNYQLFSTGEAAMIVQAGSFTKYLTKYDMKAENVGIMAPPAGPKKHVTLLGGTLYSVSDAATDDQIDVALRWIETAQSPELTEDFKLNKAKTIDKMLEDGEAVGIYSMSIWNDDTESVKFERDMIDEKSNININHVRLYNEFVQNMPCELHAEEPVFTQELYGILDACIQAVLTDKNADCGALLEKANSDFQLNYLDTL